MAAVLNIPKGFLDLRMPINGRMSIFSVACHFSNVEIKDWCLHF